MTESEQAAGQRWHYEAIEDEGKPCLPRLRRRENSMSEFERELAGLLNRYSRENVSNTPDYILAQFLVSCLEAFDRTVRQRDTWYGRDSRPSYDLAADERTGA